jgi:hypothetical protein
MELGQSMSDEGSRNRDEQVEKYVRLKVDKEIWKKFKGTSYLLGFDSVSDCLKHLIDECVKRAEYGDK